jgi:DNA-binding CsgD family transcriptional regulator/tetratricopeptide (TPR) repeat protein
MLGPLLRRGGARRQNGVMAASELSRGRQAYAENAWSQAFKSLLRCDQEQTLSAQDLELLARAAYMLGRDEEYAHSLERAFHAYLDVGDVASAARCTWWIGHGHLFRGEPAPARGWFARGQRLLVRTGDCVARGYLSIPVVFDHSSRRDYIAAHAVAVGIAEIAERFGDPDLGSLALMEQASALLRQGRREEGLRLVDETMVAVSAGELSPMVAGIVYCNTIAFCRDLFELRAAREWTSVLTEWCARQPEMLAHQGVCLVHRAELMTLAGAWPAALEEARRAAGRFSQGVLNRRALGEAAYREGELHRLRGEIAAARESYEEATRRGREPQPGLALLHLRQGKKVAAAAAVRRALSDADAWNGRAALLPVQVEIELGIGGLEPARNASKELDELARDHPSDVLFAMAAYAAGAVALADGDAQRGLLASRHALHTWQELEAPYEAARTRVLLFEAFRALNDPESAALELAAARDVFVRLDARPDLARVDVLAGRIRTDGHGLTAREVQVLRLVAAGKSNREIASALVISDRTVARHVQNIFAKLGVSSRAAASVFAVEQELL